MTQAFTYGGFAEGISVKGLPFVNEELSYAGTSDTIYPGDWLMDDPSNIGSKVVILDIDEAVTNKKLRIFICPVEVSEDGPDYQSPLFYQSCKVAKYDQNIPLYEMLEGGEVKFHNGSRGIKSGTDLSGVALGTILYGGNTADTSTKTLTQTSGTNPHPLAVLKEAPSASGGEYVIQIVNEKHTVTSA